jgi:hypothetical protein
VGNSYCIEENFGIPPTTTSSPPSSTTPPTTTTSSPNGITTPTPIQPGMTSNCNQFYYVVESDSCWAISNKYGISLNDFYSWNPYVNQSSIECGNLWPNYYVCVQIIGGHSTTTTPPPTTTTPTNGITTPTPHQTGMVTNCNKFYQYNTADGYCGDIVSKYGITLNQFYTWNPAVGTGCGYLFANWWYCIGVIGMARQAFSTLSNFTSAVTSYTSPTSIYLSTAVEVTSSIATHSYGS